LTFKSVVKEPILHFLLIGIALFVVYGRVAAPDRAGTRIVISQPMQDDMAREFAARWSRPPGEQEMTRLVDARIRDEIAYREGLALGLDRDDPVVKRRIRQKLEIVDEERIARDAPSDADLTAYLTRNAERFMRPATITFDQVYFDGSGKAADVERAVAAARAALMRGANQATLGQRTMLPGHVEGMALDLVARDFGEGFAARIVNLPVGEWAGPVASGFGAHLVRVTERTPASLPPLEAIRMQVAREWENERRTISLDENYRKLREKYDVVIDAKAPPGAAKP
jgi:parvulin-like peptidyl-prolyl isomerase